MKWVGQHIWDFYTRFRSDVYLEAIESGTIASGGNLGLDSNNKVVKAAEVGSSVDLTSEVTGVLPVTNGGSGASSLADNCVLTGTGTSPITAEANFTFDGNNMSLTALTSTFTNATTSQVVIKNTGNNTAGGLFDLINERGTGVDGDNAGQIRSWADDDGGNSTQITELKAQIIETADGSEYGRFEANIKTGAQNLVSGFVLGTTAGNDIINPTIGYGATSTTTIAGDLDIDGDAITSAGAMTFTPGGLFKTVASGVEIENGSTTGAPALLIDNDDVDQVALDIDADNTTANIIDIDAQALTTGSVIKVDSNSLVSSGSILKADIDYVGTTDSANIYGINLDIDKSGNVASGEFDASYGSYITFNDNGTNVGTSTFYGHSVIMTDDNNGGTNKRYGFAVKSVGGDTSENVGYYSNMENGKEDLHFRSSASASDYFTLATGASGATTLTTVDSGGEDGHINFVADGDVTLKPDSSGEIQFLDNSGVTKVKVLPNANDCFYSYGREAYFGFANAIASGVYKSTSPHDAAGGGFMIAGGNTTAGTTSDLAGGSLTLSGGQGKGTGVGGKIDFKVAPAAASTGSALNAYITPMTIAATGVVSIAPPDISGVVFQLDANADTDNIVDIDAGVLDIDANSITIDAATTINLESDINKINKTYDFNATTFENYYDSSDEASGTILKYSPGNDDSPNGSEIVYLSTNGRWNQANADSSCSDCGNKQLLGVGLGASARTTGVLIKGFVRVASTEILNVPTGGSAGQVDGLPLYVSDTAGHFDFNPPSNSGDFVRIVGYAIDDDSNDVLVYFDPDKTWIERA